MRLPGIRALVLAIAFAVLALLAPSQASAAGPSPTAAAPAPDQLRPRTDQKETNRELAPVPAVSKRAPVAALAKRGTLGTAGAPRREIFGYVYLNSSISDPSIGYPSWDFDLLSTVTVFGPHVNDDGTLSSTDVSVWNGSSVTNLINTAHGHGTKVVATLTRTSSVCSALINRSTTVAQIMPLLQNRADGLSVDYEDSNQTCSNGQTIRAMLTDLMSRLRAALPAGSTYLSISTYGGSAGESYPCSDPSTCGMFDLRSLNSYVDAFMVMAYDMDGSNWWHPPLNCSSYCLGPNSPITGYYWNDTTVMNQYASVVSVGKVLLGIPYYGQGACVNSTAPNQVPASGYFVDTYRDMVTIPSHPDVSNFQANRDQYDTLGLDPWDTWSDATSHCTKEMYWDDVTSLGKKYDLVNSDNLRGIGIWTLGYGGGDSELWSTIATHFSNIPGAPGHVSACAGNGSITVSWTPASSPIAPVAGYRVSVSPGGQSVQVGASSGFAVLSGLTAGTAYTVNVQAVNNYGLGVGGSPPSPITPVGNAPTYTSYFSWYDLASPGMLADDVHLLDYGTSAASGCVTIPGVAVVPFSAATNNGESSFGFLPGTIGGPVVVTVNTGPAVMATQRVKYYNTFNEVAAQPAGAAPSTVYFPWFDRISSPGFANDNLHVVNPGPAPVNVTARIPGCSDQAATIAAGGYQIFSCAGFGGPVVLTSSGGIIASQRVQYYQSFNETAGQSSANAGTQLYFSWFDKVSDPGFQSDNIHVFNPPGASGPAQVEVIIPPYGSPGPPPCDSKTTLAPGQEQIWTCQGYGGPVQVVSNQPVIAAQRVQYYQSFNEVPAASPAAASPSRYFTWFDRISDPGIKNDNLHVTNPNGTAVTVNVSIPGCSAFSNVSIASQSEQIFSCAGFGGPVVITSSGGNVLASQRVQYYQSFNEVLAGP